MPNAHKKGNKYYAFWLDEIQSAKLEELMRITGLSKTEIIRRAILNEAIKEGIIENEEAEPRRNKGKRRGNPGEDRVDP